MALTKQDKLDITNIVVTVVTPLLNGVKTELQTEIRHLGVQLEAVDEKANLGLAMLSDILKVESVGKKNAVRLDIVEANAKTLKSLVTLHDAQLRPL